MVERNLAIRLSVKDGDVVRRALTQLGADGQAALKRIEAASQPASRGLLALNAAAGEARGQIEGMAGRLGPLGAGLARLGPMGLAAGGAIAGVGLALKAGIQDAAEAEAIYRRLEAVLKSTGNASGLAAGQLAEFAESREAATLATAEEVMEASAALATFRSVSGESFTRAITLAQDMATVFRQDLRSAVVQVGKALEDPAEGVNALRRAGVSLTQSQKDLIQSLVETGRLAEAQKVVLDALEQQLGGAAEAEAGGVRGASNRLSDAWGNLLKRLGETPAIVRPVEGVFDRLAGILDRVGAAAGGSSAAERVEALTAALAKAEERLAKAPRGAQQSPRALRDRLARELAAAEADLKAEQDAAAAEETARERARLAGEQAAAEAALEAQRKANAEAEKKRQTEQAQIAESTRKVIDDLVRDAQKLTDERAAFIEQAAARLPAGASEGDILLARELAAAYFDQKAEIEDAADALERRNKVLEEGKRLTESLRTPEEEYLARLERAKQLWDEGAISAETFLRENADALKDFNEAGKSELKELERAFEGWGRRTSRTIADAFVSGKLSAASFGNFATSILSEVLERILYVNAIRPFADFLGAGFSSLGRTIFGAGSTPAYSAELGFGDDPVFVGARAAGGPVRAGMPYLVGEEGPEPFIPETNGWILPNAALGGVTVNQSISIDARGADASVEARLRLALAESERRTLAAVRQAANRGGNYAKSLGRRA